MLICHVLRIIKILKRQVLDDLRQVPEDTILVPKHSHHNGITTSFRGTGKWEANTETVKSGVQGIRLVRCCENRNTVFSR